MGAGQPGPTGPRLLVVDDEDAVRGVLVRALGLWGYTVDVAASGESALEQLSRGPATYACVLLDLTMPGMGGVATYRRIKELDAAIPVLFMSGYDSGNTIDGLDLPPPAGFLQKPFDLAVLREVVDATINK